MSPGPTGWSNGSPLESPIPAKPKATGSCGEHAGSGARGFTLYLPETGEPEQVAAAAPGHLPATRGTEAVLVIEREKALRWMIAGILCVDGYKVTDATEAERREGCP